MNTHSKIFKEISDEEAEKIIRHYFPTSKINSISLLKGGLFNTTYKLVVGSQDKELILRVGPVNREFLLPFEHNLMSAEVYVNKLLIENDIPTPTVVVCDTTKSIIDRDFMITEYINCITLSDNLISEACKDKLYEEVGRYTFKLHSIKGAKFGRVSDYLARISYDNWNDFLISHVNGIGKRCLDYDVFDKETIDKVIKVYKNNQILFKNIVEPNLVHADLWAGNILISGSDSNSYKVSAIIDADRAVFGDIDFEFASPWIINDAFIRGYGHIPENENRQLKLKKYNLLYNIIDSYVWKVQYNDINEYNRTKSRTLELLSSLF